MLDFNDYNIRETTNVSFNRKIEYASEIIF